MIRTGGRRPDVIVIVLDCVRSFDVSAVWPSGPRTTPTLERFAEQCLVFPEATTPSPWTLPAHASIVTGLLPERHGATEETLRLADGAPTLAEVLRDDGYLCAAVVCNDLVGPAAGLERGYELFVQEADAHPPALYRGVTDSIVRRLAPLRRRREHRHESRRFAADHGGARANELLRRVLRDVPVDRPLHLLVNYLEAHLPYQPPPELAAQFLENGTTADDLAAVDQHRLPLLLSANDEDRQRSARVLRSLYRATLRYVDRLVGDLIASLDSAGRLDGAVVVITSDHGENIGDHGLFDHQFSLYDTVLRIPLLVRLPGGADAGIRSGELAQLTDILPTVCDVAGIPTPDIDGQSLTAALRRHHTFSQYLAPRHILDGLRSAWPRVDWDRFDRSLRCVRTAERKYIAGSDGRDELYDLTSDPYETVDLGAAHPDAASLRTMLGPTVARPPEGGAQVAVDADLAARLGSLGYLS